MSNTYFITTNQHFDYEEVIKSVNDTLKRLKYDDVVHVSTIDLFDQINIVMPGVSCAFFMMSKRRIEYSSPRGAFAQWLVTSIENDIALKYNGWMGDENERWRGEHNKYPTYESWIAAMTSHIEDNDLRFLLSERMRQEAPKKESE